MTILLHPTARVGSNSKAAAEIRERIRQHQELISRAFDDQDATVHMKVETHERKLP